MASPLHKSASNPTRKPVSLPSSPNLHSPSRDTMFAAPLPPRKASLPNDAIFTTMVKSNGVDFVLEGSKSPKMTQQSPASAHKLFSKLQRPRKKSNMSPEKPKSLLPAFASGTRSRSESCSGTIEARANQILPSIAEASSPPRRIISRPKIVRRASSAGELNQPSSSSALIGPETPDSTGKVHRTTLPCQPGSILDSPPLTPISERKRQPSSKRSMSLRNRLRTSSSHGHRTESESSTSSTSTAVDRKLLLPKVARSPSPQAFLNVGGKPLLRTRTESPVMASLSVGSFAPAFDLDVSDSNTMTIRSSQQLDFSWRCVPAAPGSSEWKYELVIKKADEGRTPMPFSPATFSSTPSLSPSGNSPQFLSPVLRTPEPPHHFDTRTHCQKPVFREDIFWTNDRYMNPKIVSPQVVNDCLSDSDSPETPMTPRRCGFVMAEEFRLDLSPLCPASEMLPPASPTPRRHKRQSSKRAPTEAFQVADDSSESDWHEYDGFLNIFTRPSNEMKGSLANRRGVTELKLGLTSSPPRQETTVSRWSETEDDDTASLFSNSSL